MNLIPAKTEGMYMPQAEARRRFGCSHPAEQVLKLLDRVEKLEAVVSDMIDKTRIVPEASNNKPIEAVSDKVSSIEPKKRGRPRKVK